MILPTSSQNPHCPGPVERAHESSGYVFLDCTGCGKRIEHHVINLDAYTDAEATVWFNAHGWTIRPTHCPKCQGITP